MNEQNIPERALVIKATVESGPEDIIFRKVWYQDNRSETIALFF